MLGYDTRWWCANVHCSLKCSLVRWENSRIKYSPLFCVAFSWLIHELYLQKNALNFASYEVAFPKSFQLKSAGWTSDNFFCLNILEYFCVVVYEKKIEFLLNKQGEPEKKHNSIVLGKSLKLVSRVTPFHRSAPWKNCRTNGVKEKIQKLCLKN